ncbi:alpha/beta fold hydrolase [Tianweitania sediminis]|nr:alpha/beta hydrolase [Tianweitania sediminis]
MESGLASKHRVITLDLPGHGGSQDAVDPQRTYTLPGYADAVCEVLEALSIKRAALAGWSLGGHVALEVASRWAGVAAIALTGTPPARPGMEGLMEAFQPHPAFGLLSQAHLDDEQIAFVARAMASEPYVADFQAAIRRTDGQARQILFASLAAGLATDELDFVENSDVPIAIIDGEAEPFSSASFLENVHFKSLWGGHPARIAQAGHAPFLESSRAYNAHLAAFLREVEAKQRRLAA